MKKGLIIAFMLVVMGSVLVSAEGCDLNVAILNQDPYPALPGEYVKVVFQINGTGSADCERVFFELKPEFPFTLESNDSKIVIPGGTYISGYESYLLKAYKLIVDEDTIDGDHKLKIEYGFREQVSPSFFEKEFDIYVEDSRADFELFIQEYDKGLEELTFGIVNVGESDIESLTLEVPAQENLDMKGASKVVIGSLSSNDDTTATIDGVPSIGEIVVMLHYNDQTNVRRTAEMDVYFTEDYLKSAKNTAEARSIYFYLFWLVVLIYIGIRVYRYYKNKKQKTAKTFLLNRKK